MKLKKTPQNRISEYVTLNIIKQLVIQHYKINRNESYM